MHSGWCLNFPADLPAGKRMILYGRSSSVTGAKRILAADTSCSYAANVTARRASFMLGMPTTITTSGFSNAANALASPISPPWAIGGTAPRVAWRNCAPGFDGAPVIPSRSNLEECTRRLISTYWGCWLITRPYDSRVQVTLENIGQISTVLICGGNAETGLRALADGLFAELVSLQQLQAQPAFCHR